MKSRYVLTALLVGCLCTRGFGQIGSTKSAEEWRAVSVAQHQKGKWLVGAGPTFIGATAKAGKFVANRVWAGVQIEGHTAFSDRLEAGVFGRYYLWHGLLNGFSEVGVSYGRFQKWDLDFDNERPDSPELYRSVKFNAAFGMECPLSRRVSVEGVAKVGQLAKTNWLQLSVQGSVNVYLGR